MGGKGGGSETSTQTNEPWAGVQPYLTDYLKRGKEVTNRPYNFYNGDTVAGFAPEQEMGFNLGTQRALAGSPTLNAANNQITDTLNGNYLSPDSKARFVIGIKKPSFLSVTSYMFLPAESAAATG